MGIGIKKKRFFYINIFIVLLITEILIGIYVHDNFIRPYVGDILVVILLYFFVRIFILRGIRLMPLYIFAFATMTEILQYFKLVDLLGLGNNTFFRVLLGSVFDIKDIACYAIGCLLLMEYEKLILKKQ